MSLESQNVEAQNSEAAAPAPLQSPNEPAPHARVPHHHEVLIMLQTTLTFLVGALFVLTFIVQPYRIPSASMENTLLVGDFLLVNKVIFAQPGPWPRLLAYEPVRRDDIVVFHYPVDHSLQLVKRVIGIPGDRIQLRHGFVLLDGRPRKESFAVYTASYPSSFRDEFPSPSYTDAGVSTAWWTEMQHDVHNGALEVPRGEYFVLGDNRNDSLDSRYWGFVPRANIVGEPLLVYFSVNSPSNAELPGVSRVQPAGSISGAPPPGKSTPSGRLAENASASSHHWWSTLAGSARWDRIFHVIR